jgi:hypothetical protein
VSSTSAELLSTARAALLSGASYRQLNYWIRIGLINPAVESTGTGRPRRWSPEQIPLLSALAAISNLVYNPRGGSNDLMRAISEQPGPPWTIDVGQLRITIAIDDLEEAS